MRPYMLGYWQQICFSKYLTKWQYTENYKKCIINTRIITGLADVAAKIWIYILSVHVQISGVLALL